jgi:protease IV
MNFTRESIFISATRCFCNSFAVVIGVIIAAFVIMMGMSMLTSPDIVPIKSEIKIAADANGHRSILPESTPIVLRINIHGVIGTESLNSTTIENLLLDSQQDVLRSGRVKAILLHVDTPGGTVTDSDSIYRLLTAYKTEYKVPIYAFVDGMCASGGMYICAAADRIYATCPSVIGSVGVILGPTFNFSEVMDKIGIKSMTIKQGKDKDMLNPFRPWEYGAQIYLAYQACEMGYIDVADSNYSQALDDLVQAANIEKTQKYQVVQLEIPISLISSLVNGKSPLITGKITHLFQDGANRNTELSGKLLYLYQP